jgi:hypothetical protein
MVNHVALLMTVQAQPDAVVIVRVPVPPAAGTPILKTPGVYRQVFEGTGEGGASAADKSADRERDAKRR